jgi:putative heme-binding domain-containing protein
MKFSLLLVIITCVYWCPSCLGGEFTGLRVPDGFEVVQYADGKLANDIFCMTFDPRGRVVVSGPGYIRLLIESDGRAERAVELVPGLHGGPQGLFWEGDYLYFTADGGLRRQLIRNDKAVGPSQLIRRMKTGGEHEAHAIERGPDGWLYVLCGNSTGIDSTYATLPSSPIREPIAGCVLRFTPDLQNSEIVADGFRNPYGMDFLPDGELVTFDSDNERCVSLPWYEPTRFYHVIPGGRHGWLSPQRTSFWRLPPYLCDVVPPVATLGRGSPTGVVCYRHSQFPAPYQGGVFLADWTFGRIWFLELKRNRGASYTAEKRLFLEATGEHGLAPTALALHPKTGDLFVSIGGRGTRGAVYRIRHSAGFAALPADAEPQPVMPRSLDWREDSAKKLLRRATGDDTRERWRALLDIRRHRDHFDVDDVRRAIRANWDHPDDLVRLVAADLIATLDAKARADLLVSARRPIQRGTWAPMTWALAVYDKEPREVIQEVFHELDAKIPVDVFQLAGVRVMQKALGDIGAGKARGTVWEGYAPRKDGIEPSLMRSWRAALLHAFPSGNADLDREISRTLAMLEAEGEGLIAQIAGRLTEKSDPVEDIHYLIVLSRLRGRRTEAVSRQVAAALLNLDKKINERKLNRDTNWPLRIQELQRELAAKDERLNALLSQSPDFGRPDHVQFTECPGFDRRRAAEIFLKRAGPDLVWTPSLVRLLGELPDEKSLPVLRRLWERGGLEDAVLPLLARHPDESDRTRFIEGLPGPRLATVVVCLDALDKLPPTADNGLTIALIRSLRNLPDGRENAKLRSRIAAKLRVTTGERSLGDDTKTWTDWLAQKHPKEAAKLGGADGVDVEAWNRRAAKIPWTEGDAERGRTVFTRASCASCHSGAQALGPDLRGAAGRFSREDLFTAIVQPSKDVSPRYRTVLIGTEDGKTYQGIIIYEAVDSLIMQTGPDTTVRLTNPRISERRILPTSLMPAGLLDKLADRDVADLYAYLKTHR